MLNIKIGMTILVIVKEQIFRVRQLPNSPHNPMTTFLHITIPRLLVNFYTLPSYAYKKSVITKNQRNT